MDDINALTQVVLHLFSLKSLENKRRTDKSISKQSSHGLRGVRTSTAEDSGGPFGFRGQHQDEIRRNETGFDSCSERAIGLLKALNARLIAPRRLQSCAPGSSQSPVLVRIAPASCGLQANRDRSGPYLRHQLQRRRTTCMHAFSPRSRHAPCIPPKLHCARVLPERAASAYQSMALE